MIPLIIRQGANQSNKTIQQKRKMRLFYFVVDNEPIFPPSSSFPPKSRFPDGNSNVPTKKNQHIGHRYLNGLSSACALLCCFIKSPRYHFLRSLAWTCVQCQVKCLRGKSWQMKFPQVFFVQTTGLITVKCKYRTFNYKFGNSSKHKLL